MNMFHPTRPRNRAFQWRNDKKHYHGLCDKVVCALCNKLVSSFLLNIKMCFVNKKNV